jgi:hypothetical protein
MLDPASKGNIVDFPAKIQYRLLKTLNYHLLKNKFEFENYFNILNDRDIFTFCGFRLNNHPP